MLITPFNSPLNIVISSWIFGVEAPAGTCFELSITEYSSSKTIYLVIKITPTKMLITPFNSPLNIVIS